MRCVFLFSGQGSQFKGMARDICDTYSAARSVINSMSSLVNEDIATLLYLTKF